MSKSDEPWQTQAHDTPGLDPTGGLSPAAISPAAVSLEAELPGSGRVLFSDRTDGNMSSVGGEGREQGDEARERLRRRIGVSALARSFQVHGTEVRPVHDPTSRADALPHADGQATRVRGLGMMVMSADCLPVALGCEDTVAMVHAGWRGLAAGVLERGVVALRELSREGEGARILAVIGPCAGACCYEVGPEVHESFGETGRGVSNIDLRAIARRRLLATGVSEVKDLEACTICDGRFFSHRREGAASGRMAGVAWLS